MKIERFIVGPLEVCAYLVFCEKTGEAVLIDPGGESREILDFIEKKGLLLKALLATHGHPDHVLGVDFFRQILNVPFFMHQVDYEFFKRPENILIFKSWGFPENPEVDKTFKEGDIIKFGEEELIIIHTPGHSPGSACFYSEKGQVVFTGDTLFIGGVGRTDLPGGDHNLLLKSLKEKILPLPEETVIFPGHDYGDRPWATLEEEKRENPILFQCQNI